MKGCGRDWDSRYHRKGWAYVIDADKATSRLSDFPPKYPPGPCKVCGGTAKGDTTEGSWTIFCPECLVLNGYKW